MRSFLEDAHEQSQVGPQRAIVHMFHCSALLASAHVAWLGAKIQRIWDSNIECTGDSAEHVLAVSQTVASPSTSRLLFKCWSSLSMFDDFWNCASVGTSARSAQIRAIGEVARLQPWRRS